MKTFAQILMVVLFVIVFAVFLISTTFKFGLLNYSFWTSSFSKHNVYQSLSESIKKYFTDQVNAEGGNKGDVSVLTDLITIENTKDFVDNNLSNFIDFLNGNAGELVVYVPISRAPQGLLPKNIASMNNELTVKQLAEKFNVAGLDQLPLQNLSRVGTVVFYAFVASGVLLVVLMIMLLWITESDSRFISTGIALLISGGICIVLARSVTVVSMSLDKNSIIGAVAPALAAGIVNIWTYGGVGLVMFGALMLLVKKPGAR